MTINEQVALATGKVAHWIGDVALTVKGVHVVEAATKATGRHHHLVDMG
jgi:hypothetical protein